PVGTGQVGGRFNHDPPANGPSDIEPKLTSLHTEAGIVSLHLRLPDRSGAKRKRRGPTCGLRQIVDGHGVGYIAPPASVDEDIHTQIRGSITFEIGCGQAAAPSERIVSDVSNATRKSDAR